MTRHQALHPSAPAGTAETTTVHVQTRGPVDPRDVAYVRAKVLAALTHTDRPVLLVRARLTHFSDPSLERRDLAQVNVDLDGRPLRAQASRPSMLEAVDAVHDRLLARLERASGDWEDLRGGRPVASDGWRHAMPPAERVPYYPRPAEDRQVVRHKTSSSAPRATVTEAALDRELLDHPFHLFTEAGTGQDSVLWDDAGVLRLAMLDPRAADVDLGGVPAVLDDRPAPTLTLTAAAEHLELMGWPFVFYRDAASRRGHVLYHRYDGHYGLIVPVR